MKNRCKPYVMPFRLLLFVALWAAALLPMAAQSTKVNFKLTVLNSIGEPQKNLFLQIKGYSTHYDIDENGVIEYEAYLSKNYVRTAQLFFKDDGNISVKTFDLKEDQTEQTFYINSESDMLRLKQENRQVEIEGILLDEAGEPVEGATVVVPGTGEQTMSDEIGLFQITTDYNHPIIIRARGMENKTMRVDAFLRNQDEAMTVTLNYRNTDYIYNVAEEMPVYYGGMKNFVRYLNRAAAYPEEKQKSGVEGVVVVQFVVEKNGDISHTQIVRHLEPELDSIAYRAISESPRWIPARDAGRTVRCRYSMPVAFKIPKPEPPQPLKPVLADSLSTDSLKTDSLAVDSLLRDSLLSDSLRTKMLSDSLQMVADSLRLDSLRMDSLAQDSIRASLIVPTKAKKRPCAFVRFFRRLFGIKRGDETIKTEVKAAETMRTDQDQPKKKRRGRKKKADESLLPEPAAASAEEPLKADLHDEKEI